MADIIQRDALDLAQAVRTGELTAAAVVAAHLKRAASLGSELGAFVRLLPEPAAEAAARIDAEVACGVDPGALAGVPCPIKDLNAVAGVPLGAGSAALAGFVPQTDDDIVGWFAAAGTVNIGKTATPEFGLPCYTEPEGAPAAVTPWDTTRMAGGSSGGAAVAVATGMAPLAHASDGGGSIRIPAACCGVVGLKPSRGRISSGRQRTAGPGLTTDGVITRTVRDTAAGLDVLIGHDSGEAGALPVPSESFVQAVGREPRRLRIGVLTTPVIAEADVHVGCRQAAEATGELLAELGHEVSAAPVPFPVQRWQDFMAIWAVGAATIPVPESAEAMLRPLTRWLREAGRRVSGTAYAQALTGLQRLEVEISDAWAGFDLVVTPTLAMPPLPIGALRDDDDPAADFAAQTRFTPWTSIANLSGRPAISLPMQTALVDQVRLPIGVMLTGGFGQEALLLSVAAQLEAAHPWQHPFVTAAPN